MRVVMFGDFSGRSVGHNALLRALVSQLGTLEPSSIIVPTLRPQALRRVISDRIGVEFLGVAPWHGAVKFRSRQVRRAVDEADLVLLVDNQLHDKGFGNPLRSNLRSLVAITARARKRGVPTAYLHGSLGPLRDQKARRIAASLVRQLDLILLRDAEAQKALAGLAPEVSAEVTADAAFSPSPPARTPTEGAGWIGVNLTARTLRASQDAWVGAIAHLRAHLERRVLIVVTHPRDRRAAEALARRLGPDAELLAPAPETFLDRMSALPSELACVVGDRYHELVMFAAAEIPIVGSTSGDKVPTLLHTLELPDLLFALRGGSVGGDDLVAAVRGALERRAELAVSVARQRAAADDGIVAMRTLIDRQSANSAGRSSFKSA